MWRDKTLEVERIKIQFNSILISMSNNFYFRQKFVKKIQDEPSQTESNGTIKKIFYGTIKFKLLTF